MKALLSYVALLQLISLYHQVSALSTGAPAAACSPLAPNVAQHLNAQPQSSSVPYIVDLVPFCDNVTNTYMYYPGMTYTSSLHGENNDMPQFRGLLVQARLVSDDTTMVGTFAVNPASSGTSELSACTPATSAITHSNGNDKSSVYFDWTAPANGTGPIRFAFAVVQTRAVYWANQRSLTIAEAGSGGVGSTCVVNPTTTEEPNGGTPQLNSIGFSTLLMVALAVTIKVAQ